MQNTNADTHSSQQAPSRSRPQPLTGRWKMRAFVSGFLHGEVGRSLPAALIAITLGSILLVPFLSFVSSRSLGTRAAAGNFEEQYAADAGVEYAIWSLLEDPSNRPTSLPEPVNGHNPSLTITEVSSGSSWLQDPPADPARNISSGGGLAFDGGSLFYALVGGGDNRFYRYNSTGDSWTQLSRIPNNLQIFPPPPDNYGLSVDTGSDLAYTGSWNNDLYALVKGSPRGRRTPEADFLLRYSIPADSWELAAKTPDELGAGASLAYDGSSSLYAFQGGGDAFWRYTGSGWQTLQDAPGAVGTGAALVYTGGNSLYAFQGGGSSEFWRYEISSDSWTVLSAQAGGALPGSVTAGGSLAFNGDASLYALPGGSDEVWRYTITTNTWGVLSNAPAGIGGGGDLAMVDTDSGYVLRGGNTSDFWAFTAGSPLYDIHSQAGNVSIRARVEIIGSSSMIIFWAID